MANLNNEVREHQLNQLNTDDLDQVIGGIMAAPVGPPRIYHPVGPHVDPLSIKVGGNI